MSSSSVSLEGQRLPTEAEIAALKRRFLNLEQNGLVKAPDGKRYTQANLDESEFSICAICFKYSIRVAKNASDSLSSLESRREVGRRPSAYLVPPRTASGGRRWASYIQRIICSISPNELISSSHF